MGDRSTDSFAGVDQVVQAFESVSTWEQPPPAVVSPVRRRLRVAVDGYTAAGRTTSGHELATAVRHLGRPTTRASMDGSGRVVLCAHDPLTGVDHRIRLQVDPGLALTRGILRDVAAEGAAEVDVLPRADAVVGGADVDAPRLIEPGRPSGPCAPTSERAGLTALPLVRCYRVLRGASRRGAG